MTIDTRTTINTSLEEDNKIYHVRGIIQEIIELCQKEGIREINDENGESLFIEDLEQTEEILEMITHPLIL